MNTPNTNAPSTKAVAGVSPTQVNEQGKDVDLAKAEAEKKAAEAEAKKQAEFEAALKENDNKLSPEEAKAIQDAMGDESEAGPEDETMLDRLAQFVKVNGDPRKTIPALLSAYETTPDEYVIGGAGGVKLMVGHLRALVAGVQ